MKAIVIEKPHHIRVENVNYPTFESGKTILQVLACGVCGTDYKIYSGETEAVYPVIPGHEIVGIVKKSDSFEKGQFVVVDPNKVCGRCEYCRQGKVNLCTNLKATGVTEPGGFSEALIVEDEQVYPLLKDVPLERAVFSEPVSCILNGIRRIRHLSPEKVLIVGAGSIGVIFAMLLEKMFVAGEIALFEEDEKRAEYAEKNFNMKVSIEKISGMYDLTIECSGSVEGFKTCFEHVGKGGTILQFGVVPKGEKVEISPFEIYKKEIRILGACLNPFTMREAVRIIESGEYEFERLVTDTLTLEEVKNYLETHKKPFMKAMYRNI